jgi:hypothetical protein
MRSRACILSFAVLTAASLSACQKVDPGSAAAALASPPAPHVESGPDTLRSNRWEATYPSSHLAGLLITQSLTFTDHGTLIDRVDCLYSQMVSSDGAGSGADLHAAYEFDVTVDDSSVHLFADVQNQTTDGQSGHLCHVGLVAGDLAYAIQADGHLQTMGHEFQPVP